MQATRNAPKEKYPIPGPIGAKLIRQAIAILRRGGVSLPVSSHIHIAISGGSDSVALAHLIVHFGRRIAPKGGISLLHFNHGWRGAESDLDEEFVRGRAKDWGVPVRIVRMANDQGKGERGSSWEDGARTARKLIYDEFERAGEAVLTAHHADDLAETMLWRLFTGAAATHGGGILIRSGAQLRPLLCARKAWLRAYLGEVGESWREDATNHEGRFLRSRMRERLMPEIEAIFPRAIGRLVAVALEAQKKSDQPAGPDGTVDALAAAFRLLQVPLRGPQWRAVRSVATAEGRQGREGCALEVHLPGGWRLTRARSVPIKTKVTKRGRLPVGAWCWILDKT